MALLALAIVLRRKLAAPIARVTDFGPAVMLQAGVLRPNHPRYTFTPYSMYLITWITTHLPTPEGWMAKLRRSLSLGQ